VTGMALARLEEMKARSRQGGGPERLARQHARGKMSARERLEALLDPGSFFELDAFAIDRAAELDQGRQVPLGDGVVTGWGQVDGRRVYVFV